MKPSESVAALNDYFKRAPLSVGIALADELSAVMDFYVDCPAGNLVEHDADMLLFQYGCHDWGQGLCFEIDLVRQFITRCEDDENGEMSQLHFTVQFEPDNALQALGTHSCWCTDRSEIDAFREYVLGGPIIGAVEGRERIDTKLEWEEL